MDAPLSSPSHTQPRPGFQTSYFTAAASSSSSSQSSAATAPPQAQTHQTQPPPPQHQQHQQHPQPQQRPHPTDNASHFLQDFSLVAEAAKRAQMAVLMRDLEAVGI